MRNTTKKSFVSSRLAPPNRTKGEPMRKLTKEQKRDIRAIAAKRDEDIDFSDAPAVVDWSGAEIGKFYRPTKKPVTIELANFGSADRKSTRLNSSHGYISYAVFCLKKKNVRCSDESHLASI